MQKLTNFQAQISKQFCAQHSKWQTYKVQNIICSLILAWHEKGKTNQDNIS